MYIRNYRSNSDEKPPEKPFDNAKTQNTFDNHTTIVDTSNTMSSAYDFDAKTDPNEIVTAKENNPKRMKLRRSRVPRFSSYANEDATTNEIAALDSDTKSNNFLANLTTNIKLDDAVIGSLMLLFLNQNSDDILILAFAYLFYIGLL